QVTDMLRPDGYLLLEIGQGQGKGVTTYLHSLFSSAKIKIAPDLSGIERVVSLRLTHNPAGDKLINWVLPENKEQAMNRRRNGHYEYNCLRQAGN
ncbi:MAG: hypothetical protein V3S69_06530, partial [Dehalococcoidales bacterium]